MKNELRNSSHQKSPDVEAILEQLEQLIGPADASVSKGVPQMPEKPVVFIVGCARSGTTVLMQILAESGYFCYPSNLMSRFFYAPYIGSLMHKLLIDYDYKGEIFDSQGFETGKLKSTLGKTLGARSPHEYWYFWKQFFDFGEIQKLNDKQLETVDKDRLLLGLSSIQTIFQKPLVMKGLIMNWHIPYLAALSKNFYFIHIQRSIDYNALSLLNARKKFFDAKDLWYSFKPPEYESIKDLTPAEQVVLQVHFTNKAVTDGLAKLGKEKFISIKYEEFCAFPAKYIEDILKQIGVHSRDESLADFSIKPPTHRDVPKLDWEAITSAIQKYDLEDSCW